MKPVARYISQRRLRSRIESLRPRLFRLARSWCHDTATADDLVQDTLVRGLEKLSDLREHQQLEQWLCRIMANLNKDRARKAKPETPIEDVDISGGENPEAVLERQQAVSKVVRAMELLKEDQRMVLTMVDLMDYSYAEVAAALEIPVGTVMSRISRARQRLKVLMAKSTQKPLPRLRSVK